MLRPKDDLYKEIHLRTSLFLKMVDVIHLSRCETPNGVLPPGPWAYHYPSCFVSSQ